MENVCSYYTVVYAFEWS